MSRMIALLSVVIVLFAVAAGGSWYLQNQQAKDPDPSHGADEKPGKASKSGGPSASTKQGSGGDVAPKGAIFRNSLAPPDSESLTQLAAALQQQQDSLKAREQQLGVREKQMDIVHDLIKKEQKKLDMTRKEIQAELQALEAKFAEVDRRIQEGVSQQKLTTAQKEELDKSVIALETQEWKNLKDQIKKLEAMEPEPAAVMLTAMVDAGKEDSVVKMLYQMRHVQAAAILAEISKQDAKLSAQLFERTFRLKTPTIAAPK